MPGALAAILSAGAKVKIKHIKKSPQHQSFQRCSINLLERALGDSNFLAIISEPSLCAGINRTSKPTINPAAKLREFRKILNSLRRPERRRKRKKTKFTNPPTYQLTNLLPPGATGEISSFQSRKRSETQGTPKKQEKLIGPLTQCGSDFTRNFPEYQYYKSTPTPWGPNSPLLLLYITPLL